MEYWCQRRLVITVEGPQGCSSCALDQPFARIGADAASDVVLAGDQLERRCLYLHATDQGVFGVRLAPSGHPPRSPLGWLSPDQKLCLGAYQLSVRLDVAPEGTMPRILELDQHGSAPQPPAEIRVSRKGRLVGRRPLTRALTLVGRSRPCPLRIPGASVSTTHCVLFWDAGQLWVIDLLSHAGTRYQGQVCACTLLAPQESVELGHYTLTLAGTSGVRRLRSPRDLSARRAKRSWTEEAVAGQDTAFGPSDELARSGAELATERESLRRQQSRWAAERESQEQVLAERTRQLAAEAAQLEAARLAFEQARAAGEEEPRRIIGEPVQRVERLANEIAAFERQRQTPGGGEEAKLDGVEEPAACGEASRRLSLAGRPSTPRPQPIASSNSSTATAGTEVTDADVSLEDVAASVTVRLVALHHSKRVRGGRWGRWGLVVLLITLLVIAIVGLLAACWIFFPQDWEAWLQTIKVGEASGPPRPGP
jgi:FHA domain